MGVWYAQTGTSFTKKSIKHKITSGANKYIVSSDYGKLSDSDNVWNMAAMGWTLLISLKFFEV